MKAVTWNEFGAQPALRDDLPEPTAGADEVLVRVHASSVNPVDNAIAAGMLKDMVPHEFPRHARPRLRRHRRAGRRRRDRGLSPR